MKRKKKTVRQKRIAQLDKLWVEKIKERDKGICQKCGKVGTQAHHIFGRGYSVRWDMDNGVYLCYTCHLLNAHSKNIRLSMQFKDWVKGFLGHKYEELMEKSSQVQKFNKEFYEETLEKLKEG